MLHNTCYGVAHDSTGGAECLTRTDDLPLTVPLQLSLPVVRGLDYPLALAATAALGPPRLVSTPSRMGLARDWRGCLDRRFPRI